MSLASHSSQASHNDCSSYDYLWKSFQLRQTSINLRINLSLVQAECAQSGHVDLYNPVALENNAVSSVVLRWLLRNAQRSEQ